MNSHPFFPFRHQKDTSEQYQLQQIEHLITKIDFGSMRRKTQKERDELNTAIRRYPNKNHCPVPPNN